jgi:hypothetical protein
LNVVDPNAQPYPVGANLESVDDVVFSPDGNLLALTGYNQGIRLWDIAKQAIQTLEGGTAVRPAFSQEGKKLAWAESDGVWLWEISKPIDSAQDLSLGGRRPHRSPVERCSKGTATRTSQRPLRHCAKSGF